MKQNPKTEQQAIEKIYRVRMYLIRHSFSFQGLTLEQIIARNQAERVLSQVQSKFW